MRLPYLVLSIVLVLGICADWYIYALLRTALKRRIWSCIQAWSAVAGALLLIALMCIPTRSAGNGMIVVAMWMIYIYLSIYIPKFLYVIIDILSRLPRLWGGRNLRWLSCGGAALACMVFLAMWWGALFNRYNLEVRYVTVPVKNLPKGLEGFTIAQISDLHVGSLGSDTTYLCNLVGEVNSLHPDVIVFTGDIVNRNSLELKPFTSVLSRLMAPYGIYSILGNHDYGDYENWDSEHTKKLNRISLENKQRKMGWKLLNNETSLLNVNGDSLFLIGVENIGDPPFHIYGSLSKAYATPADKHMKIMLSHNPAHWDSEVEDVDTMNIALTLSGHTHAMQTEIAGLSPSVFRYRHWGGLYTDKYGRHLYVNIGAGTVGFPARIGANPEITLLTLKRAK